MIPTEPDRAGILAAGNWIIDQVKMIDEYPEQDALAFIIEESSANGGGPYNLVKNLARLGAPFALMGAGLVGDDANGVAILEDCRSLHIDTSRLGITDRAPTSYTDVMTARSSGRRTFFHQPGANALLTERDIDFTGCTARVFYLGYLLLLEGLDHVATDGTTGAARLLERAEEFGMTTVVDLVSAQEGHFREVVTPSLRHIDVLFLNEYEAGHLLGEELLEPDAERLIDAGQKILRMGVRCGVVLHCPEMGVAVPANGDPVVHGAVVMHHDDIKGAAGAGDAFAAGMLFGLHEGEPLARCLKMAVCSAASCLTDPTTSMGVKSIDECLEMGENFGFRHES